MGMAGGDHFGLGHFQGELKADFFTERRYHWGTL